jgi:hypothetical protein
MENNLNKKHSFHDIWNTLSHSQKNIIYKLGCNGWQLDYSSCEPAANMANIIHYNGDRGRVSYRGEVEFVS